MTVVVARWAISANGIARPDPTVDARPRVPDGDDLEGAIAAVGDVPEVVIEGDPERLWRAFERGCLGRVECRVMLGLATAPDALAVAGLGVASVGEGWRLADVRYEVEGNSVLIVGRVTPR